MSEDRFFAGLNASVDARDAPFLNFGYLGPGARRTSATATSTALVEHLLDGIDLDGRRVLDIGCGRGGGLRMLADRMRAGPVIGLDLDPVALAAARKRPRSAIPPVLRADALALPVRPGSVDAVVNIESACLYGDLPRFHAGVARALRPAGHLLYADIMPTEVIDRAADVFAPTGLAILRAADITGPVLASVRARMPAAGASAAEFLEWFAAALEGHDLVYGLVQAQRTDHPDPERSAITPAALSRLDRFAAEALERAGSLLP